MKSLEIINKMTEKEAVKLDSQLVELGVMQDMQKWNDISVTQSNELKTVLPELKRIATDAYNSPAKALIELKKSIDSFETDAKSLGLNPQEFKPYTTAVSNYVKINSELDKFYNNILKSILK
jgi:hypothetical protein